MRGLGNRIVNTFAARELQMSKKKNFVDNLDRYCVSRGYGLKLYKRECKRVEERIT